MPNMKNIIDEHNKKVLKKNKSKEPMVERVSYLLNHIQKCKYKRNSTELSKEHLEPERSTKRLQDRLVDFTRSKTLQPQDETMATMQTGKRIYH